MADYEIPTVTGDDGIVDVPALKEGTMAHLHGPWI